MPKVRFFVGKGGVGKTTVSAAYAVHLAGQRAGESVLLISTDPAHSLEDVFQQELGDSPSAVRLGGKRKLHAWQVNAEKEFGDFLAANRGELLSLLEAGSIFSRADLAPLLDSVLPGMAEISALLATSDAVRSQEYSRVVVDTAPFGHTLRLFSLPESFVRFVEFLELGASRDRVLAAHFGGKAAATRPGPIAKWRELAEGIEEVFARDSEVVLVTSGEKFALNESLRATAEFRRRSPGFQISHVVLNRAVLRASACALCRKRRTASREAAKKLKRDFPGAGMLFGEDGGFPIIGADGLAAFGKHVFSGAAMRWRPRAPRAGKLRFSRIEWPVIETPLSLVAGKGGVGKTTVSAALGFQARAKRPRGPVEICSVDPAPSLDDVFASEVTGQPRAVLGDPKFRASEMDAERIFREWVAGVSRDVDESLTAEVSGIHVDLSFERRLIRLLIESVPPGLDEVLAVLRIHEMVADGGKNVIIDMAPTGHALELLRTPERLARWSRLLLKTLASHRTLALARDAGASVAELGKAARDLRDFLGKPRAAGVFVVMLPELLPDRETERLFAGLRALGLPVRGVFVNRVLMPDAKGCARCRRAGQWQAATLANLRKRFLQTQFYLIRNFPDEISGGAALKRFTKELWRVS